MGRPPLPVGTAGKVRFQSLGPRQVRARANVRDYDGETREVNRVGATKAAAERALKEALRDRVGPPTDGEITPETRLRDAAKIWFAEVEVSDLADGSKAVYERTLNDRVIPALGGLRLREVDVPACDRFLKTVRTNHGPGAAKTARTVLSPLLAMAVRHGALAANPVRDTAKITAGRRSRPKALTVNETDLLLEKLATDPLTVHQDIAELVEFMLGSGVRVGEALGVRRDVLDLDAGVVEVNATAVRLTGKGTTLQFRTKSDAGWRVIALPDHIIELCRHRMETVRANEHGLLFPGLRGGVRNPSGANGLVKKAVTRVDPKLSWVTTHTFRKTVATRLDEAGLTARQIADHLGHAEPSMTQDVYMGRQVAAAEAAAALSKKEP